MTLAALTARHGPVIRVLVVKTAGSVPRGPGTTMIVWADGQDGTIGGGALEHRATLHARTMLDTDTGTALHTWPLGPDLGQCCGGSVTLVWERITSATLPTFPRIRRIEGAKPAPPLPANPAQPVLRDGWLAEGGDAPRHPVWIWGAGHVGRALVGVLAPLPDLAITWADTSADRFPTPLPDGIDTVPTPDLARLAAHAPRQAAHIIVTHSHDLDLALCDALLRRGFRSAGVIGSATKWARFGSRLAALGHAPAQIGRITCPIGDPTLGKHPQAIALGVATRLLAESQGIGERDTHDDARHSA